MNGQHLGLIIMFGLTFKAERFVSAFDNVKKTIMFCRVKCKRYLVRNGCPICECNPFVYDQPFTNITCSHSERKCLVAGSICKTHS
ncbi:unnamed protein product [Rotaria sp. Silwood1]|nr:unnamed protein product [Rotaria sp. Silwood1]CAF1418768.1 unnamed protein product [Rotaria sp. Silwood1]CAF3546142.1 unnamed protein product [Rotaria sp. Silwood1]